MEKIRRYFHQNKKKILKIAGIVIGILVVIQLLNFQAKKQIEEDAKKNTTSDEGRDVAVITDKKKSTDTYTEEKNIMQQFIDYCNQKDYENAYALLTSDCKSKLYPNIDVFKTNYCELNFGTSKSCDYQLWEGDTYIVEIRDNIMVTGEYNKNSYKRDYYTVKQDGLNIGGYIGSDKMENTTTKSNITIKIDSIDYYMDYLEINIVAKNGTNNNIILDPQKDNKTVVLTDENGLDREVLIKENTQDEVTVDKGEIKKVKLKSNVSYKSDLTFKKLTFSKVLLNADTFKKGNGSGFIEISLTI